MPTKRNLENGISSKYIERFLYRSAQIALDIGLEFRDLGRRVRDSRY